MNEFIVISKKSNTTKEEKEHIENELYRIFIKYF